MGAVNGALNMSFDLLFLPFARLSPWWGMAFISLLTGLLMLLIFRLASNQAAIRRTKERVKAHLLEFRLYKESPTASAQALGGILLRNLRYLSLTLKPLLVMIIPLVLILAQLNARFGFRPLQPGEQVVFKVKTAPDLNPLEADISLDPTPGFLVETPPLRIEKEHEVNWRLRVASPGRHDVTLRLGDVSVAKSLDVGPSRLKALSPRRPGGNIFDVLLNPAEKPLPRDAKLASIEVVYPPYRLSLFGLPIHWLLAFFVLSLSFGLSLKGLFKVEI